MYREKKERKREKKANDEPCALKATKPNAGR